MPKAAAELSAALQVIVYPVLIELRYTRNGVDFTERYRANDYVAVLDRLSLADLTTWTVLLTSGDGEKTIVKKAAT